MEKFISVTAIFFYSQNKKRHRRHRHTTHHTPHTTHHTLTPHSTPLPPFPHSMSSYLSSSKNTSGGRACVVTTLSPSPTNSMEIQQLPLLTPNSGEVVIQVKSCGVNFPDLLQVQGKYQFKPPLPFAPGGEVVRRGILNTFLCCSSSSTFRIS